MNNNDKYNKMTRRTTLIVLLCAITALTTIAAPKRNNILSVKDTITDHDIVYPTSFETNTREMMQNWYLQNYAVLDADVEKRDVGEVSKEEYINRLKAMPTTIEMPYNQVVRSYIDRYIKRSRTLVEEMLGMSLYYMPIFEQALEKEGLPLELKYLPVIESALNPNAVSPAGAGGLWQFMVGTGKGLGLEINSLVDERRDPYRSSEKAAQFLKNLFEIYNDWSLAIAAYNCGPGNVNKALRRAGGEDKDFWEIYPYLPKETRGYVPAFIAANYVMTYYKRHNISPSLARRPLITDTVAVRQRVHFSQLSQVLNMPIEEIRILNPQYRADVIPASKERTYMLCLPSTQVYSFIMSEDSIYGYRNDIFAQRGTVEPVGYNSGNKRGRGQTTEYDYDDIKVIHSEQPQLSDEELEKEQIDEVKRIEQQAREAASKPGQRNMLEPKENANYAQSRKSSEQTTTKQESRKTASSKNTAAKNTSKKSNTRNSKKTSAAKTTTYTVKKGESLGKIARKNGITVAELKKANNIKGDKIKAGETIKIPAAKKSSTKSTSTKKKRRRR